MPAGRQRIPRPRRVLQIEGGGHGARRGGEKPLGTLLLAADPGFKTRIHLYTVPGQVFYDASRKLILRGVDGIVFVADSQEQRMDANVEALENLMSNLKEHSYDFNKIPYVLQLNKRDLPNVLPVDELSKELRKKNEPVVEAVAFQGTGVFETLKEIAKQVLTELKAGG